MCWRHCEFSHTRCRVSILLPFAPHTSPLPETHFLAAPPSCPPILSYEERTVSSCFPDCTSLPLPFLGDRVSVCMSWNFDLFVPSLRHPFLANASSRGHPSIGLTQFSHSRSSSERLQDRDKDQCQTHLHISAFQRVQHENRTQHQKLTRLVLCQFSSVSESSCSNDSDDQMIHPRTLIFSCRHTRVPYDM